MKSTRKSRSDDRGGAGLALGSVGRSAMLNRREFASRATVARLLLPIAAGSAIGGRQFVRVTKSTSGGHTHQVVLSTM